MSEEDEVMQRARARVGTVLNDKWRIDAVLGVGGMASVYAATHRNQKRVAVKMLHPELSADAAVRARFLREGYVANTVEHRGAVSVHDDDVTEDGAAFLVMELLEGETLEARRHRKGGSLPTDDVLSLVDQLLDVLAAAHDKGIVHRDLKPENLFLTQEGVVKVLDFGIARLREGAGEKEGRAATRVGSVMGTPAFMAPEQARGRWELVDARTDLWAVGATMFTLLSGRFVREAETVNEELALAVTARAPSVATVVPDLHPAVVELVDKTLAYEKDVRWPDARAMQLAVRQAYAAMRAPGADAPSLPRAPQASVVSEVEAGPAASTLAASTAGSVSVSAPPARSGLRVGLAAGAVVAIGLVVAGVTLLGGRSPAPAAAGPDAQATVATVVTAAPAVSPSASAEPAGASAAATASAAPSASTSASATASPAAATASATATATAAPRNVPAKRDPFSRRK